MVRFRDPTSGIEQWIGRETPFYAWQTWDDPRQHYPGDPADVLDDRSITHHPELPFGAEAPDGFHPTASEPSVGLAAEEDLSIDL